MKSTTIKSTKAKDIKRAWHLIDVKGKTIGNAATEISVKLMGKQKANFVRHLDCGDFVIVVNSKLVESTGKKETKKMYGVYSGYPGGLKQKALWQIRQENPNEIIRHAVWGMLPTNKLRDRLVTRLFIYPDENHPYKDKFHI
ncbi:MAG: 50S ribosomal protein L13 [Candidatus Gottesmanbacteria bacterium GW2011_GWA2_44_17]|uniref:Large ribosomal subunit protein uL13 n=1 Tax=Candidatus Gottesmanbacteria bacterium GW2011_GWA2_44_17 TaxID=1618444 RepID=A0A0G1JTW9_9BACT|nr:MAG: 50S ribosomal protein L13 [Candidatus Gottesmanbacteria bacterium GW2011_GWA2_44_17]